MYPANREKDSGQSGTGIYYQAIPAVSADGKNIMKLIPVEMVDGRFFQTEIRRPRIDSTPQRSLTTDPASAPAQMVKRTTLNHFSPQQSCRKQVSHVKTLSRPVELDHGYSLNKQSLQQQILNLTAKGPSNAAPATNCDKSVERPCRLPVTVRSTALPQGHQILIPPNAQVQTFPASVLPPGIMKQICNLSDNSSSGSSLQNVVFVSPVRTVIQGSTSPNDSDTDSVELFSHTSYNASCASQSKASKPHLKLVPKVSQRPNSPIKWVIEEAVSSTDQNLLKSQFEATEIIQVMTRRETADKDYNFMKKLPSIRSEILQSLAERETANNTCDGIKKTISQPILGKSGERQENALVMCNGKVFLMAKKGSLPFKMGQDDPTALSTKSYTLPKSQKPAKPVKTQTQQGVRIVIPDDSDEIIDLCDDEDATQPDASVEEDNVIFVSYIPPKTESTSQTSMPKTQTAPEKETVQEGTSSSNSSTDENHLESIPLVDDRDECSALGGRQSSQSMLANKVKNASVSESAVMNTLEDANVMHQQSTSGLQDTGSQADPNMSDSSSGTLSGKEDAHKMEFSPNPPTQWTSSLAPKPRWKADHLLRKKFGITANVNICLQRIDETSPWFGLECHLQNKSISEAGCLENLYMSCKTRETNFSCVKKVKLQDELQLLTNPATHSVPHTDVTVKDKCLSGQSSLCRTLCDGEALPVFGYVEPIDDDFLSTHEDNISKLQTCVKLNTSTRRLGRTRKRTMCPCCTAGTLDHEADRLAFSSAEQIRKKEGRTKAPGKD